MEGLLSYKTYKEENLQYWNETWSTKDNNSWSNESSLRDIRDKVVKETLAQDYAEDALQYLNFKPYDLLPSDVTAEKFVDFGIDVSVAQPTPSIDQEILQAIRFEESIRDDEDQENEFAEEETIVQPKHTHIQNALNILQTTVTFSNELGEEMRKSALNHVKKAKKDWIFLQNEFLFFGFPI